MNREKYINDQSVASFAQWLAERLDDTNYNHSWIDRRSNKEYRFSSIYDAYRKYHWRINVVLPNKEIYRGFSFKDNEHALGAMSNGLKGSISDSLLDDDGALYWSFAVLRWGGVYPSNGEWLNDKKKGLAKYLYSNLCQFTDSGLDLESVDKNIRFNSGMTKIYSLLADKFIIYDSRVAAALGMLVSRFCQERGLDRVPEFLQFPWAPAKEGAEAKNPKNRNPSKSSLRFPRLSSGYSHFEANMKANWLLVEVLGHSSSKFRQAQSPLRALESALFMIGYDIPGEPTNKKNGISDADGYDSKEGYKSHTRGGENKRRYFNYAFEQESLIIINDKAKAKDHRFTFREIYNILNELRERFAFEFFPLANDRIKMSHNDEQDGLGMTIFKLSTVRNPEHSQAASYLGVVLEDLGFLEWNGKHRGIEWRLVRDVPEYEDFLELIAQAQES